jgi:hypothetical protein
VPVEHHQDINAAGARLRFVRRERVRNWGEWLFEVFGRGGYFSLRPLPMNDAEREQAVEKHTPPNDITRLNLEEGSDSDQ